MLHAMKVGLKTMIEYPLTDEILEKLKTNPYFAGHKKDQIIFTYEFYLEMYRKITVEGKTYVEAYNELGFDTKLLGEPRATAVGMRIMKMAAEHKLFRINFSKLNDLKDVPDDEVVYLLCEREEFLRQLLFSVKEVMAG